MACNGFYDWRACRACRVYRFRAEISWVQFLEAVRSLCGPQSMVEADIHVLLDEHAAKRPVRHLHPATRRSRDSEFVRSVNTTRPYSIKNHKSSNAPQATIDHSGVLALNADYICFSPVAEESQSHQPGHAQHKFDGIWVIFGMQLQRAICFKSDDHELTVVRFFTVGTTQQWMLYKRYLNTLES